MSAQSGRLRILQPGRRSDASNAIIAPAPSPTPGQAPGRSGGAPGRGGTPHGHGGTPPGLTAAVAFTAMAATSAPGRSAGSIGPPPDFVASATTPRTAVAGTITVNLPTYSAGNVVLVLFEGAYGNGDNDMAAAGWTEVSKHGETTTTGNDLVFVFSRTMDGSEGATVTFTISGTLASTSSKPSAVAASYSGAGRTPLDPSIGLSTPGSGSTTWSVSAVTTSGVNRRIVTLVGVRTNTVQTQANGTQRVNFRPGDGSGLVIIDYPEATPGDYANSGTIGFSFPGAVQIALTPASFS